LVFDEMAGHKHEKASFKGISPCITKSRPKGFWMSRCRRHYDIYEMGRLQGIPRDLIKSLRKGGSDLSLA
jgi:hypothetical protein